jgi:hypothetical protein
MSMKNSTDTIWDQTSNLIQYCHEPRKIMKQAIGWDVNIMAARHTVRTRLVN